VLAAETAQVLAEILLTLSCFQLFLVAQEQLAVLVTLVSSLGQCGRPDLNLFLWFGLAVQAAAVILLERLATVETDHTAAGAAAAVLALEQGHPATAATVVMALSL